MLARVPLAIVVGVIVGVIGELASFVAYNVDLGLGVTARVGLARTACSVVEMAFVTIGVFELARRGRGRARLLLHVAGALQLALTAWFVARPLVELAVDRDMATLDAIYRQSAIATGLAASLLAILLTVVARKHRGAVVLGAFALLLMLTRGWFPGIGDVVYDWLGADPTLRELYWAVSAFGWSLAIFGLCFYVAKDALPDTPDPAAAASGFGLLATALQFRIVAAIVIALLGVTMVQSAAAAKVVLVGGPLVILATTFAAVLGILRTARSRLDGLPVCRLAVGGALVLWYGALQLEQVNSIAQLIGPIDYGTSRMDTELAQGWSIVGPLIAAAGFVLVGSAISAFAGARTDHALRESASLRTRLFVILSASAVAIQSQLGNVESRERFLVLMFAAAAAAIAALVAFARLANHAARAIDAAPTLPTARVR